MIHIKFQGNRSIGCGEDFWMVFSLYGHGGHLGHVTQTICINFHSCIPISFHIKFYFQTFPQLLIKTKYNFEI